MSSPTCTNVVITFMQWWRHREPTTSLIKENSTWSDLHWWRHLLPILMTSSPTHIDDVINYMNTWCHREPATSHIWRQFDMPTLLTSSPTCIDYVTTYMHWLSHHLHVLMTSLKLLHHRYKDNLKLHHLHWWRHCQHALMTSSSIYIDDIINKTSWTHCTCIDWIRIRKLMLIGNSTAQKIWRK